MAEPTDSTIVEDHRLLNESLGLVAPRSSELIAAFYDKLFTDHPGVRQMFPEEMEPQREKLLKAIIALVTNYDSPDQLAPALTSMGRNHAKYGALPAHFDAVGATLLATLRDFAGEAWTPEYEGAWTRAYTAAAGAMMAAGAEAQSN